MHKWHPAQVADAGSDDPGPFNPACCHLCHALRCRTRRPLAYVSAIGTYVWALKPYGYLELPWLEHNTQMCSISPTRKNSIIDRLSVCIDEMFEEGRNNVPLRCLPFPIPYPSFLVLGPA